jgi:glycosyltransferase involved in cell wall biosynthesis
MRIGVISDEFFHRDLGGMGGFGWAAWQLSRIFEEELSLNVEIVYLAAQHHVRESASETSAHGRRLVLRRPTRLANLIAARREKLDLLLTIDYNLSYSVWIRSLPRTPCIVWSRDPRTESDVEEIYTLRIPGAPEVVPQGLYCINGRSLQRIARESLWTGRKLMVATPSPMLTRKFEDTYGFEPWNTYLLPNPLSLKTTRAGKSSKPTAVFLGRIDPIKRPWVFTELARRFPAVEFLILGQAHFSGLGAWEPVNLPSNVRLLGHTGEEEKTRILSEAWVTVNTSIHEALAVSLLESLACGTPLLSCQNPEFVASRFGVYAGRFGGDGMAGLDAFALGLETLLASAELRLRLGESGRQWVDSVHSRQNFLDRFQELCRLAGVRS